MKYHLLNLALLVQVFLRYQEAQQATKTIFDAPLQQQPSMRTSSNSGGSFYREKSRTPKRASGVPGDDGLGGRVSGAPQQKIEPFPELVPPRSTTSTMPGAA